MAAKRLTEEETAMSRLGMIAEKIAHTVRGVISGTMESHDIIVKGRSEQMLWDMVYQNVYQLQAMQVMQAPANDEKAKSIKPADVAQVAADAAIRRRRDSITRNYSAPPAA